MPKSKFELIYKDLKEKIESEEYKYQSLLPSENTMTGIYDCTRNTIRRAIGSLITDGYVQSMHGIGVRVIYQPIVPSTFTIAGIESFKESAIRNHKNFHTTVLSFTELTVDERISKRTGFPLGEELIYIQRIRSIDEKPLIFDINLFLKSEVLGLTKEIAQNSIYDYLEGVLHMNIVTSKRTMTVEKITQADEKYLDLSDYNCLAVISSQTYNSNGIMFEYTQSRHRPDYFCFQDTATRTKK